MSAFFLSVKKFDDFVIGEAASILAGTAAQFFKLVASTAPYRFAHPAHSAPAVLPKEILQASPSLNALRDGLHPDTFEVIAV